MINDVVAVLLLIIAILRYDLLYIKRIGFLFKNLIIYIRRLSY